MAGNKDQHQFTIALPDDEYDSLDRLAESLLIPKREIVRRGISIYAQMMEAHRKGEKVTIGGEVIRFY